MKLRTLPASKKLKGIPVLVRVDWNVPLNGTLAGEDSLKLTRSIPFVQALAKRGAVVIVLTHLGRPKKKERSLSTRHLVPHLERLGLAVTFHPESVSKLRLDEAAPGSVHLLENVRFEKGEEKNDAGLIKGYAKLASIFINDAFASCHRKHASVVGLAKAFKREAYAGPGLVEEVGHLAKLLAKPRRPFVAVVGGKKLSSKIHVVKRLLEMCDAVLVGGAMAAPFFVAKRCNIGKSYYEAEALPAAKKLLKERNLFIPADVMVSERISASMKPRPATLEEIRRGESIVDVGPATLASWGAVLREARTILWNGPIGITEYKSGGFGSRFLARHIGVHARGPAFAVAGGGDTIPIILSTDTLAGFDFVSTGGGAMLEFIALKGKLPGLEPLAK